MKKLLNQIFRVLDDFVTWFWNGVRPPQRKSWCAVFYFVAQEDAGVSYPETSLDTKLAETITTLTGTTFNTDRIHVVYRAIWADPARLPIAKVVSSSLVPPKTTYFPGCYEPIAPPINTGRDLPCFLEWVYKWCPADHYAIFFWGHSFGPAGLFEPGGSINIPRPAGLTSLKAAFDRFRRLRMATSSKPPAIGGTRVDAPIGAPAAPAGSGTTDDNDRELIESLAAANPRVEVVLFQDCWMSTLETVYELGDLVQYVIASQSLIPIGLQSVDFVWPYGPLLQDLLKPNFQEELASHISYFYDSHFTQIARLVSVPIALLDLRAIAQITPPLKALRDGLMTSGLSLAGRGAIMANGQIVKFGPNFDVTAGDAALVDVRLLCQTLLTDPNASATVTSAATALLAKLPALIKSTRESLPANGSLIGFGGVSVMYRPPPQPLDRLITQVIIDASYAALNLSQQIAWPGTEQARN